MSDFLHLLQHRNSAPKLQSPAPDDTALAQIFTAALRAPDHAWLHPWRFLTIAGQRRQDFGQILEAALLRRNPDADAAAREKAQLSPQRAPLIVVVVAVLRDHPKVPKSEQRLSSACAAQAILLATEALGYAGIWRTGDAAFDRSVMTDLGLAENEEITGFLYLGTRVGEAKKIPLLDPAAYVRAW